MKIALGSDSATATTMGTTSPSSPVCSAAGLGVEEVLLAATAVGAELCGVDDRFGRIAPGYEFDAVVLDDEPADLGRLGEPGAVSGVFRRGPPVVAHPRLPGRGACVNLIKVIGIMV